MQKLKPRLVGFLVCLFLLNPPATVAMILPTYDLTSLVFLSTDIVIADISESEDHGFSATVTESLYGSIKPGEKLDTLTPFLSFFKPMESGMRAILFLDRRPHKYDSFNSEAAKSPFAVAPSGVYLIDEYDHVHEYSQPNNPGPYVAQHYSYFFQKTVPTKEQDLALPALAEVKARIAAEIVSVNRFRPLLERTATPVDFPALLQVIDTTPLSASDCDIHLASAIRDRALQNIHSLRDPIRYLIALSVGLPYGPSIHSTDFLFSDDGTRDKDDQDNRIRLLLRTLSDRKADSNLRIASAEILISLSRFRSGAQSGPSPVLPIDNDWLRDFAAEIQATAKSIFDDASQDTRLRVLCVQFLDVNQPPILLDVRSVYAKTQLGPLRFAIESSFLMRGDTLYSSLNSPRGPVAASLSPLPESACAQKTHKSFGFRLNYHSRLDYPDRGMAFRTTHAILTNAKTHARFDLENMNTLAGWYGVAEGETDFELSSLGAVPPGDYSLVLAYDGAEGQPRLFSYGINVTVRDSATGKIITARQ